jgi:hypothetical protein
MPCPVDDTELVLADRAGIEIDWCPTCRGVWLDRGELDKIVERSSQPEARLAAGGDARYADLDDDHRPRGRRRAFLDDLFDFG